jgi:hypothetical protein
MNRLMVMLGLDAKQFKSGAAAASSYASSFATSLRNSMLSALGPIAIAMQVMGFIKGAFDEAKAISDMSKRFDVSSDSLQRMAAAGKKVGLEMNNIATIIKSFKKGFADAFKNEAAVNDLLALGFTMEEIKSGGIDAQTAILRLSEALDKAGNKTEFMHRLTAAFGKSSMDIMAMLSMSTEELANSFREAAIMSKAQIEASDELGDAWDGLLSMLKPVAMIIVGLLGMIVSALAAGITTMVTFIAGTVMWAMNKLADFLDMLSDMADYVPGMGGIAESGRKSAGMARTVGGVAGQVAIASAKGADKSWDAFQASWHAFTMGSLKDDKPAPLARRDTESITDEAGVGGKGGGSGASFGVSGMASVGGGGLVGGGYDPSLAVATASLDVAKEQLRLTQEQVDILKNKSPLSR